MDRQELEILKEVLCPHDEDYSEPCISPEYLGKELEELFMELPLRTGGEMGMTDKEQVIYEIKEALDLAEYLDHEWQEVEVSLLKRVLALLKEQEKQEESVPLEPLCRWLSHYAVCPTKTGKQPPTNIEMVRAGWENWFRNGFQEWLRMEEPER